MLVNKGEPSATKEYAGSGLYAARDTLPEKARSNAINIMSLYARALQEAQDRQLAMSAKASGQTSADGAAVCGSMSSGAVPVSTGDPEYDRKIREAIEYYNSCFDFSNQDDFENFQDISGLGEMSDSEKYAVIYRKYQHCFGENFLEGKAADLCVIPSEYDKFTPVTDRFQREVRAACGGYEGAKKARREALYSGCETHAQVRQAIIEKYVKNGNDRRLSRRNYFKMTDEMDNCGVGGGIGISLCSSSYMPDDLVEYLAHGSPRDNSSSPEYLDGYITESDIRDIRNSCGYLKANGIDSEDYLSALEQIISCISPEGNSRIREDIGRLSLPGYRDKIKKNY